MKKKRNLFKIFNSISLFSIIFVVPLILNFYQTGPNLLGNKYQTEIAYIENLNDLFNHLLKNLFSYLNIFNNPIFWFFVSAFLTQKTIRWVNSD